MATFLMPPPAGDATDAGQLGLDTPSYQSLDISPVVFRKTRATMTENQPTKYELLVSGSAIAEQVSLLQLDSADALLRLVAGVNISGLSLLVEAWSCSALLGSAVLYRMLLRVAESASVSQQS